MQLAPYLQFSGQCEEAFRFYEKVLNGKITYLGSYGDSPMADQVAPEWAKKIMNVTLEFANQRLHGCDAPPDRQGPMRGFALSLETTSVAESEKLFQTLAEGGAVTMPLQQTFWSPRFGMFDDKYGVSWMINTADPSAQPQS